MRLTAWQRPYTNKSGGYCKRVRSLQPQDPRRTLPSACPRAYPFPQYLMQPCMVFPVGLEPTSLAATAFETAASANSATRTNIGPAVPLRLSHLSAVFSETGSPELHWGTLRRGPYRGVALYKEALAQGQYIMH